MSSFSISSSIHSFHTVSSRNPSNFEKSKRKCFHISLCINFGSAMFSSIFFSHVLHLSLSDIPIICTFYLQTYLPSVLFSHHFHFSIFCLYHLEKILQVCLSAVFNLLFTASTVDFNLATVFYMPSESRQNASFSLLISSFIMTKFF